MRLAQQKYGEITTSSESIKQNYCSALNIIYSLTLSEALLFLAERAYWEWKLNCCCILEEVHKECRFELTELVFVRWFFDEACSCCRKQSIFYGKKMTMVSFAEELSVFSSRDKQLIGVNILLRFVDKMSKIDMSMAVIEKLVVMLNRKNSDEEKIRRAAAKVVSKLVGKKHNEIRMAQIRGAMKAISSLLDVRSDENDVSQEEQITLDQLENKDRSTINHLGLLILKKLAKHPVNFVKIGKIEGLIPKLIDFITIFSKKLIRGNSIASTNPEIKAAKRALLILKRLASTTGRSGETLRREISESVFAISSIRDILVHGKDEISIPLQKLGVEVLTCLAMDKAARERIGATGGMIKKLMKIFLDCAGRDGQVRMEAGEALAMLVVESESNCRRALSVEENVVERLVEAIVDPLSLIGAKACKILTFLCAYEEAFIEFDRRKEIIKAFPTVMHDITVVNTKLEILIGLIALIVGFMSPIELVEGLERANVLENQLTNCLVHILQKYNYPSFKTPNIRRNVIEISICLMESNEKYIKLFNNYEMVKELHNVAETTADLECFIDYSGHVGIGRYMATMASLVDNALELLGKDIVN